MREFDIVPHVGVGPVKLGMTQTEVHEVLGEPDGPIMDGRESFMGGFFVDFDSQGRVEFIELAASSEYRALYEGACLHELLADDVVALVCQRERFDESNPEVGYSYVFIGLQLSLWRGTRPEPDQPADDMDGRRFEAVGIASRGYFTPGAVQ